MSNTASCIKLSDHFLYSNISCASLTMDSTIPEFTVFFVAADSCTCPYGLDHPALIRDTCVVVVVVEPDNRWWITGTSKQRVLKTWTETHCCHKHVWGHIIIPACSISFSAQLGMMTTSHWWSCSGVKCIIDLGTGSALSLPPVLPSGHSRYCGPKFPCPLKHFPY